MEAAWRPVARAGKWPDWMPEWTEPFARTVDAACKHVVSGILPGVDRNAELVGGDGLEAAVRRLKRQPGRGLFVGGMTRPLVLA